MSAADARANTLLPVAAIGAAMVSQYGGAALAKSLFPLVGSSGVVALRVGLSAILLAAWLRPWRARPSRAELPNILLYGIALGSMNLLIYCAFARIPIGVAVSIEVTGPLAVVLLSSRRPRDFAWLGCAGLGLWLLLPLRHNAVPLDPAGIAYAAGAAACWALYIVFGQRAAQGTGTVAWGMLAAATFAVPIGAATAGPALLAPAILAAGLGVAILSSAAPYSLEMVALRRLPRRVFGMLVSASPAVAALAGFALLGERLAWDQWAGIALVVAACAGSAGSQR